MTMMTPLNCFGFELKCPKCSGLHLHHSSVAVYSRAEDEKITFRAIVGLKGAVTDVVPSEGCGNPSARRDGITIEFWCETCNAENMILAMEQHKGSTSIYWLE